MSGRKKALIIAGIVIAVLLLLWLATELIIPRVAASYVTREIRKRYPQAGRIEVSVDAFPAIKLAFKKYDDLRVEVAGIELQDVDFTRITLDSDKWPDAEFEAVIDQKEITRFFSTTHSYVINPTVTLEQDAIRVNGDINVGGIVVGVDSLGNLEPVEGRQIYFRPTQVNVSGISVPSKGVQLVEQIMNESPAFTVREDLPYEINSIKAGRGRLVIEGTADLEKALDIKL